MKFSNRLILGAVIIVIIVASILVIGAQRWLRDALEAGFAETLTGEVGAIAEGIASRPDDLHATAHRYGSILGRRVTLIGPDGRVLGDSEFDRQSLALLDNHADRPEVRDALANGVGVGRRLSESTNRVELKVAVRAWPGVVRISAPVEQVDTLVRDATGVIMAASLLAILVAGVFASMGGRAIARPLGDLVQSARTIAANQQPTYPDTNIAEIRELVWAIRSMQEDLEERVRALHREREETGTLIDSMVEGVLAADQRGRVVLCNETLRKLLGYEPSQSLPNLTELFYQKEARDVVTRVMRGEPVLGREVDLEGRIVLMTARPLPNRGAVLGLLDVTDVRRVQLVRRDFVANVSHELKTPLTSILGYAETLQTEDPDQETRRNFLSVILGNARRMQFLVDDLLDLARVESGAWIPRPEPVDLALLAREVWQSVGERHRGQRHRFAVDVPEGLALVADLEGARHILTNLIDNAARHTPQDGAITVAARPVDRGIEVTVSDTGSGIPSEHIPRVFERFYRVDPGRSRAEGGTGLGLAIVKHLCESQGIEVTLTSGVGRGTTVKMVFPHRHQQATVHS